MKRLATIFTFIFIIATLHAQLKDVIVEKYYISDANDAKYVQYIYDDNDHITDSVKLEEGSVTYRVYIQLAHSYKLTRIYGDANHPIEVTSTANFFNNILDNYGASFGYQIPNNHLNLNTVALDTWLTLGQATNKNFGILKNEDNNGSLVGGTHNKDNLLNSQNPAAGTPLTVADGLVPIGIAPSNWQQTGIVNKSGDSTIFGSLKAVKQFKSKNASLQNSGVMGADTGNTVLVAQLTTKGDISFKLNIQVIDTLDVNKKPISFVADTAPGDYAKGNQRSKYLTYPQEKVCGCNDPGYSEYKPDRDCDNAALCKTKIVFGCMDPHACNYDPAATNNISSLCCYPGKCADRDISLVCPDLGDKPKSNILLYPNPVNDQLTVEVTSDNNSETKIEIYNSYGRLVMVKNLSVVNGTITSQINMSGLETGMYMVRFFIEDKPDSKILIKNPN